ncbi:fatty acyl-AMP ligase [Acetobacteraceae bacterium]|nr:fatty acyl-AMP ligase [Acetobacteraceae bacterium]
MQGSVSKGDLEISSIPVMTRPYGENGELRTALDWRTGWLDQILGMRAHLYPENAGFYFLDKKGDVEGELSVQALEAQARKVAGMIAAYIPPRSPVVLLGGNYSEFLIGFFGIIYAGCIPVSGVSPSLSGAVERLRHVLSDSKAAAVFGTKEDLEAFSSLCADFNVRWLPAEQAEKALPYFQPIRESHEDTAFIQYTSGTEGKPRGVPVSQRGILTNLHRQAEQAAYIHPGPGLSWLPFTHDMGLITTLFLSLASGERVYIQRSEDFIQNPASWLEAISRYQICFSIGPVFAYDLAVAALAGKSDHLDLSSWRVACVGSGPLHAASLQKFANTFEENGFSALNFRPGYGMAETTLIITSETGLKIRGFLRSAMAEGHAVLSTLENKKEDTRFLVSCGAVLPDHEIRVRSPVTDEWLQSGEVGDIWVTGACVAKSYIGSFEREGTELSQRPVLFYEDEAGKTWFRTGDAGFLFGEELFVLGRVVEAVIQEGKFFDPYDLAEEVRSAMRDFQPEEKKNSRIEAIVIYPEGGHLYALVEADPQLKRPKEAALAGARRLFEICGTRSVKVFFVAKGGLSRTPNGKLRFKASAENFRSNHLRTWGEYMFGAKDLKVAEYKEVEWLIP